MHAMRHDPAHGLLAAVTIDASKVFETGSLLSTRKSSELFDYSTSFEGTLDQNMLRCQNGVLGLAVDPINPVNREY